MEISKDGKINFEKVIVTPIERWEDLELELTPAVIRCLNRLAEKSA